VSLLAGLSHRGEYPQAVLAEFEALMVALKTGWATDTAQPGMAVFWFDTTAPDGWAFMNGQTVLRKDNPVLTDIYTRNPTSFGGGDGVTTMTLPNTTAISPYMIMRLG